MASTRLASLRFLLLILLLVSACAGPHDQVPASQVPLSPPAPVPESPPTSTTTQVLTGEIPAALPESALPAAAMPTIQASKVPAPARPSALVISWDGASAQLVYDLMARGELPHFSGLARRGLRAAYALAPDPTLTFTAHASLAAGALPARTGLVSNAFHDASDSFYWYRQAADEPFDAAEPVWVSASRAGLLTATVAFPGSSTARPSQMADYTIDYGIQDAYSRQAKVPLEPAGSQEGLPPSFSPALYGLYRIPSVGQVHLLVVDTSDDADENYDSVYLLGDHECQGMLGQRVGPGTVKLRIGEWGSLELAPQLAAGADFLIQEISDQEISFYHSGVFHNRASPSALIEALNKNFGFYPSGGDAYALEHGWITEADYLTQVERRARWTAEVTAWLYRTYQPDLLFAWQEPFDSAGHTFLLVDPRQPGYSSERARQYAAFYRQATQIADQALAITLAAVDLDRTAVLLASDHGMAPAHTRVYLNTLLQQHGLLVLDQKDYVVVEKSRAIAVASGGAANIYLNIQGREGEGLVAPQDALALQERIVALLSGLVDPQNGQPVLARVLSHAELGSLGLDHPHSGDVFVQAYPGYSLDGWRGEKELFAPSDTYGQHGYASDLPEMRALFIAAGAGVPAREAPIPPLRLIDLAPSLAALLGFEPAPATDGVPIPVLSIP